MDDRSSEIEYVDVSELEGFDPQALLSGVSEDDEKNLRHLAPNLRRLNRLTEEKD